MQDREGADFIGGEASHACAFQVEEFAGSDNPAAPFWREGSEASSGDEFNQGDQLGSDAILQLALSGPAKDSINKL